MHVSPLHKRLFRFLDHAYVQFSYIVFSRVKNAELHIPEGHSKGVVLSFDVETWENRCGGRVEPSADPEDEYFRYLPDLLDLFKSYSVSVHFFVCGKVLELYPGVFGNLLRKGHGIGGHGYMHEKMYTLSDGQQREVVRKVSSLMQDKCGVDLKSWRCPGLAANRETYRVLNKCGVRLCSNAPWGRPMLIEGVVEVPIARKMDNQIMKHNGSGGGHSARRWGEYMVEKFKGLDRGVLVFGMHTWVQRKCDPGYQALTIFLDFFESYKREVWIGGFDDLYNFMYRNT